MVLPSSVTARVAVEQASTFGWQRYVGLQGATVGMHTFGASAPLKELQKKFGFTVENVVAAAKDQIKKANPTDGYRKQYGSDTGPWTTDMFVTAVYRSLTAKR